VAGALMLTKDEGRLREKNTYKWRSGGFCIAQKFRPGLKTQKKKKKKKKKPKNKVF
jgi:hypothetical protein